MGFRVVDCINGALYLHKKLRCEVNVLEGGCVRCMELLGYSKKKLMSTGLCETRIQGHTAPFSLLNTAPFKDINFAPQLFMQK